MTSRQECELIPFVGYGGIDFGAPRSSLRAWLGVPSAIFRRANWAPEVSDQYRELGVTLNYAVGGLLDSVEMHGPAKPMFQGIDLLGAPSEQVFADFSAQGLAVDRVDGDWNVREAGISLYSAKSLLPESCFDAVTAFRGGVPAEPEFFDGPPSQVQVLPVSTEKMGAVRLGMDRGRVRELLGAGMATCDSTGEFDVFWCGLTVWYDASQQICRVSAGSPASVTLDGFDILGRTYSELIRHLDNASVPYTEREAEVFLSDLGIRARTSRAHDPTLPVSAVAIGS
ncbi:hypothetical protein GA0115240_1352138 [Streptomyces sp. DvalAA-14]|uniref:hypothetical protein n=1 Tax=unclassified Streptomyces TaxID=2593676 RepID=UPI00081B2B3A|nr:MULTISPECIES: hypothetical protein [unclassified Streptomyces]MYS21866.1 hypothetical protein [Streptomyces sp. SID4948]SCE02602.1 hypothetical protein GA0115240_1352138 [Streptomyces sp. DvalAA-14]